MKAIVKQSTLVIAGMVLALPLAAQQGSERRAGNLSPLNPAEMEAATVPMGKPPEKGTDAYERWLEEQRRRLMEEPYIYEYDPERFRDDSQQRGLTPFQQQFRDALVDGIGNTADSFR